jgi:hypothetical protein
VGGGVAFLSSLNDGGREGRSRGLAVPIFEGEEVIADKLFVEARLGLTGNIGIDRPESAAVGSEEFVDQDDLAVDSSELELGVCNNNPPACGEGAAFFVKVEGPVAKPFIEGVA